MLRSMRKIWLIAIVAVWGLVGYFVWDFAKEENIDLLSPISKLAKNVPIPALTTREQLKAASRFQSDILNILVIGTDSSAFRRAKGQGGFNTDSLILVSINPSTNKVLLTSVPRDLWINGNKINALYTVFGEDVLVDAFEKITGQYVDGVIRADFDSFEWVIDAVGGVPVNVERTFTDTTFPNRADTNVITISFAQGPQTLTAERALVFSRSRHGDNGEGSDLMRAKRQHLVLEGLVQAINQPTSKYWPMNVETFYNAVTSVGNTYTTLSISDAKYLWDFYKDKDLYTVESFVLGDEYIYHPTEGYIAWVFIPREPGFATLHQDIINKLNNVTIPDQPPESAQPQPSPAL